jgi:multidrug resistance efflux pump
VLLFSLLYGCGDTPVSKTPDGPAAQVAATPVATQHVIGLARIEPEDKTVVFYPQVTGIVDEVAVKLSEKVTRGQVLFVINHDVEDQNIAIIQTQIQQQQGVIASAAADLEKASIDDTLANRNFERIQDVFDQGADTRQNLDDAQANATATRIAIASYRAKLATARARLGELQANLRLAQVNRDRHFIKAPAPGIMTSVDGAVGEYASPAVSLGEFAPESPTVAVTEIDELFAAKVQLNQAAIIRLQGSQDTLAKGEVVALSPALRQKSLFSDEVGQLEDRRVREVKVRLTSGADKVMFGQRVECLIHTQP